MTIFWYPWKYLTPFSTVSVADFELANACLVEYTVMTIYICVGGSWQSITSNVNIVPVVINLDLKETHIGYVSSTRSLSLWLTFIYSVLNYFQLNKKRLKSFWTTVINDLSFHCKYLKIVVLKSIIYSIKHANFSALQDISWQSYIQELAIYNKFIKQRVQPFIHQTICLENNVLRR